MPVSNHTQLVRPLEGTCHAIADPVVTTVPKSRIFDLLIFGVAYDPTVSAVLSL